MSFTRLFYLLVLSAFVFSPQMAYAGEVEDHAPIGVMGDHYHKKGEWMTSYRYMRMDMPQNYSGSKKEDVSDVHNDYMISPVDMTMEMHMVGIMYGVTDDLTAMLMIPYSIKDMEHRRRSDGRQFSTRSSGIGDLKFGGMYSLKEHTGQPLHFNFSVSFPTGSINRKDDTLAGADQDLPYPMQLGSGTYDFLPGITYFDKNEDWSWGAQVLTTLRFGRNEYKYRLGNEYQATSWIAYTWTDWLSSSFRIRANKWGDISGADPRLNPNMVPTADPELRAGERIDLLAGVNLLGHEGILKDHRLAIEFGHPVYQHLDGPQLGVGLHGTIGWQKAF